MEEKLLSKKKPAYPISGDLEKYLERYNRRIKIPIFYDDLLRFHASIPVYDKNEKDTLWVRCAYTEFERDEIEIALKRV